MEKFKTWSAIMVLALGIVFVNAAWNYYWPWEFGTDAPFVYMALLLASKIVKGNKTYGY